MKMRITPLFLMLLCSFLFSSPVFAEEAKATEKVESTSDVAKSKVLLLIFDSTEPEMAIKFTIPEKFSIKESNSESEAKNKFVLNNKENGAFQQIILGTYNEVKDAKQLTNGFKEFLEKSETTKEFKVLDEDIQTFDRYKISSIGVSYIVNDKPYIVYLRFYVSSTGFANVQWTELASVGAKNEEQLNDIKAKMNSAIKVAP
jgi:hypothetical protein